MPISSAQTFEKIVMNLSVLRYIFKSKSKRGLYDLNKQAEPFFRDLLNMVYGWELENMNLIQANYPAIDLGDSTSRICVQVTAQNSSKKIHSTITKFVEKKLFNEYDRVVILLLTDKKSYTAAFETSGTFTFDRKRDILDVDDLLARIERMPLNEMGKVSKFLQAELAPVFASIALSDSVFSQAERRPDSPPKNARRFLQAIGFDDESPVEDWESEYKGILQAYERLQKISRQVRGFLALIVDRGEERSCGGRRRIAIHEANLAGVASGLPRHGKSYFNALEDSGLADIEHDGLGGREGIVFARLGLACGEDFLVFLKDFCKTEGELRRVIEDCDFTLLDE